MAKILLVEDNEMNRDMLSRRLARKGFEVVMALDGQQAVEAAAAQNPDLILMDMSLPVIDGWEATRRIKAAAATSAIPVIALTAHAMQGDEERARACGCDDYLTKPIDEDRLFVPSLDNKVYLVETATGAQLGDAFEVLIGPEDHDRQGSGGTAGAGDKRRE